MKPKGRILEGKVISDKMHKTITVLVRSNFTDPIYKRSTIRYKKYKVHDSLNKAKAGDRVRIIETRPYSKEKHFKLLEIVQ